MRIKFIDYIPLTNGMIYLCILMEMSKEKVHNINRSCNSEDLKTNWVRCRISFQRLHRCEFVVSSKDVWATKIISLKCSFRNRHSSTIDSLGKGNVIVQDELYIIYTFVWFLAVKYKCYCCLFIYLVLNYFWVLGLSRW